MRRTLWNIVGRAYAVICIRGTKRSLEDLAYLILIPDVPDIHRYHHQPNIAFRMGLFLIDNSVVADRRTRLALLRLLIIYVYVMFFVRFLAFSSSYWNPTAFNHLVVFVSSIQAYYISGLIAYIPHIYFLLQTSAHRILEDCFHSVLHTCIEALTNYSSLSNI